MNDQNVDPKGGLDVNKLFYTMLWNTSSELAAMGGEGGVRGRLYAPSY